MLGDRLPEPTETFAVNLSATTNAFIADGQGVGTILDNEPRISINDVIEEGRQRHWHDPVHLHGHPLGRLRPGGDDVDYATADGTATTADHDYVAKSGTLTFAPGETTKTITITVYGDKKEEPNETFFVNLSGTSSNALFSDMQGIGTILNDDRKK